MKTGAVIALALLTACLGFALGATLFEGEGHSASTDSAENRDLRREVADLRENLDRIRSSAKTDDTDVRRTENDLAAARAELDRIREDSAAAGSETAPDAASPSGPAPTGPRFFADAFDGALRRVDWDSVGTNMHVMTGLIPKIAADLAAGKDPSPEDLGRVQQHNGPLVTAALQIQASVPGTGVNGRFSDPSFMLNAMAATLSLTETPLTEAQEQALEATAKAWMAKDIQRRESYDDRTWLVQRVYEEAELKDGFFRDAFTHLTADQVETLSPASVRGRVRLDLFSSSLIYAALSRPDFFVDLPGLVDSTLRGASASLRLTDEEREAARPVVAAWVDRLPQELVQHETDGLDQHGLIPVSLITLAARQQHELLRTLASAIRLDDERMNQVRGYGAVHVPLPRKKTVEGE